MYMYCTCVHIVQVLCTCTICHVQVFIVILNDLYYIGNRGTKIENNKGRENCCKRLLILLYNNDISIIISIIVIVIVIIIVVVVVIAC